MRNQQHVETAEQLMREIAPVDLADGFTIIPATPGDSRLLGWSVGNGQPLAAAAGLPLGSIAVGVNVEQIQSLCDRGGSQADVLVEGVICSVAAHELAHALVSTDTRPATAEEVDRWLAVPVRPKRPDTGHHARWAAAYGLLLNRGSRLFPPLAIAAAAEAPSPSGFDLDELLAALGPVPLEQSIRGLLADGTAAANRVDSTTTSCPQEIF